MCIQQLCAQARPGARCMQPWQQLLQLAALQRLGQPSHTHEHTCAKSSTLSLLTGRPSSRQLDAKLSMMTLITKFTSTRPHSSTKEQKKMTAPAGLGLQRFTTAWAGNCDSKPLLGSSHVPAVMLPPVGNGKSCMRQKAHFSALAATSALISTHVTWCWGSASSCLPVCCCCCHLRAPSPPPPAHTCWSPCSPA